jgi:hypothetical protein
LGKSRGENFKSIVKKIGGLMCRKTLAVFLAIIFVPIFITTIVFISLKSTLLNQNFINTQLNKNNAYTSVTNIALDVFQQQLAPQEESQTTNILFSNLSTIVKQKLPADYLKSQLEPVINGFFAYLKGTSSQFSQTIDLKPFKAAVSSATLQNLDEQLKNLATRKSQQDYNSNTLNCIPANMSAQDIKDQWEKLIKEKNFLQSIPDNLNVGTTNSPNSTQTLNQSKQFYNYLQIAFVVFLFISIILFICIGLLIFKPASSLLNWLATILLIPGTILFFSVFGNYLVTMFLKGSSWNLPAETSAVLNNLIGSLIKGFIGNIAIYASILVVLAVIMYIISAIIKKRSKDVIHA